MFWEFNSQIPQVYMQSANYKLSSSKWNVLIYQFDNLEYQLIRTLVDITTTFLCWYDITAIHYQKRYYNNWSGGLYAPKKFKKLWLWYVIIELRYAFLFFYLNNYHSNYDIYELRKYF